MILRARKAFRLQLLPLVVAFAVLAALVGARSLLIERQRSTMTPCARRSSWSAASSPTLSLVQDAETGQRGFLLTGEASYLTPYQSAVDALPAELEVLKGAMSDDPTRLARLGELNAAMRDKLGGTRRDDRPLPGRRPRRRAAGRAQRSRQGLHGSPSRRRRRHQAERERRTAGPPGVRRQHRANGWAGPRSPRCSACLLLGAFSASTCAVA